MNRIVGIVSMSLVALTLFAFALLSGGCSQEQESSPAVLMAPPEKINVLLITIDTLRGDYLGISGQKAVSTPEIDRMAREGAYFSYCVAHNTVTLPSHVNILTGTDPREHGVHDNSGFRLVSSKVTLAEMLKDRGYNTAAFVGAFVLDSRTGIDQGFDHFDDYYGIKRPGNPFVTERPAEEVVTPALKWLREQDGNNPWFEWIHVYDPHWPHEVPVAYEKMYEDNLYAGEISYVDDSFKPLFDYLRSSGLLDSTLLIITSDHGESLNDHGESTHGMFCYNSTLWVPLIIRAPWQIAPGLEFDRRVSHVDLVPTILDTLGVPVPQGLHGRSLVPLYAGNRNYAEPDSYFEALSASVNRGWAPLRGVLHENWKYIDLPIPELYDMNTDFMETSNIIEGRAGTARQLRALLARMRQGEDEGLEAMREESADALRRLEALGYLTGAPQPLKDEYGPEDDPKNLIHLNNELNLAIAAAARGDIDKSMEMMNRVLAERPDMAIVYQHMASILVDADRAQEAVEILDAAIAKGIARDQLVSRLAIALVSAGDTERSAVIFEEIYNKDPESLETAHYLAISLAENGDYARAEEFFLRVINGDESFIEARGNYGWMLLDLQRDYEAQAQFEFILSQHPKHAAAQHGMGLICERRQLWQEALQYYSQALENEPRRFKCQLQMATLLTRLGQYQAAIPLLERFLAEAPEGSLANERAGAQRLLIRLQQRDR